MSELKGHARGELRASDADRRLVEELLNNAYVDGRLTKDELDERLEGVWASRTFNDLAPLTTDLVENPAQQTQYTTPASAAPHALVDTTSAHQSTDQVTTILGETKRLDQWRMHQRTNVTTIVGETRLDLTRATLESRDLHLNALVVLGELVIRVPEGMQVVSQASNILAESHVKGLRPGKDPVTLTITGFSLLGEVKVIGPDHRSFTDKLFGKA